MYKTSRKYSVLHLYYKVGLFHFMFTIIHIYTILQNNEIPMKKCYILLRG